MSASRTISQRRHAVIDQQLRKAPPQLRTRDAIITALNRQVMNPRGDGWSRRTFERDKDFMRDKGAPISVVEEEGAEGSMDVYCYQEPEYRWSDMPFSTADIQALRLAQAILQPYAKLPAIQQLNSLAHRLEVELKDELPQGEEWPVPEIHYGPCCVPEIDPTVWNAVLEGLTRRRCVKLAYRGWKQDRPETRSVDPYALVNLEGHWYLLASRNAFDEQPRQYRMGRIANATLTDAPFVVPDTIDVQELLKQSFGSFLIPEGAGTEVVLHFNERVALPIQERLWHAQQQLAPLPDGRLELRFPITMGGNRPMIHVARWVRSWGPDVEVLAPPMLRDRLGEL